VFTYWQKVVMLFMLLAFFRYGTLRKSAAVIKK